MIYVLNFFSLVGTKNKLGLFWGGGGEVKTDPAFAAWVASKL